jgi:hypothetical protein
VEAEADARMALDALPHRSAWFVPHAHGWLAQLPAALAPAPDDSVAATV